MANSRITRSGPLAQEIDMGHLKVMNGVVEMQKFQTAEMPCEPKALVFQQGLFQFVSTQPEAMEVAITLILECSLQRGCWVGVSLKLLAKKIRNDIVLAEKAAHIEKINQTELLLTKLFTGMWWLFVVASLGLLAMLIKKPEAKLQPVPLIQYPLPRTPESVIGIAEAIDSLIDSGLILLDRVGKEEVLFPTPALVQQLIWISK